MDRCRAPRWEVSTFLTPPLRNLSFSKGNRYWAWTRDPRVNLQLVVQQYKSTLKPMIKSKYLYQGEDSEHSFHKPNAGTKFERNQCLGLLVLLIFGIRHRAHQNMWHQWLVKWQYQIFPKHYISIVGILRRTRKHTKLQPKAF